MTMTAIGAPSASRFLPGQLFEICQNAVIRVAGRREDRKTRKILAKLDDHILRDIGVLPPLDGVARPQRTEFRPSMVTRW